MTLKENIEELQERMKYSGFGDTVNPELEKQIKDGKEKIVLGMSKIVDDRKLEYALHFRQSDEGRYYYNGFDATLTKPDDTQQSHRFYQNQGISAKEAFNLLEGRAVFKSLFNKEGERYNAWIQLELDVRDGNGKHPVTHFHQNYGFELEKAVEKLPLKYMDGDEQRDMLHYSLKKGNQHQVEIEGRDGKFQLEANPRYKNLNLIDAQGTRIKLNELSVAQRQVTLEVKKKDQDQTSQRKVKV